MSTADTKREIVTAGMTISLFRGYRVFFCSICELAFQFGHLDGRFIDEADDQQGDDANDPFEVDDVRQQADSRA